MSQLETNLNLIYFSLNQVSLLSHANRIISFDLETICPPEGQEEQSKVNRFLSDMAFKLLKDPKFDEAREYCFLHLEELTPLDQELIKQLERDYLKTKNVSPEFQNKINKAANTAYLKWIKAKNEKDFSIYAPALEKVIKLEKEKIGLQDTVDPIPYNNLIDLYERGMNQKDYDDFFSKLRDYLVPRIPELTAKSKKVRTDFLSRDVPIELQKKFSNYLLETIGFNFKRGAISTTEHPFTESLGEDDNRVTTHYFLNNCVSNMFSVVHEGGHAIFGQNQPAEHYKHFIDNSMSMGMHESVSRFFENRIGRSKEFIHLIYPEFQKIFAGIFDDVSEKELYEGINTVKPSLIRTESDEFTYSLHIIIRYELEKKIINEDVNVNDLPKMWDDLYEKYLGVRPSNDAEGILQDVHWTSGFGYFPCYALGNAFNAMYYERLERELDINKLVSTGDFKPILKWMTDNVFAKANYLDSKAWIEDITGEKFSADAFIRYLDKKYK